MSIPESRFEAVRGKLFRLKTVGGDFLETQLRRCLSTFDITLLGVGHMIGAGVYVLTGEVAHNMAGPGIILSFFIAGIASLLAALCYAEFGARVPKAGSAYTYTYVTVGEFWAFVIGWNIILEHMLGAAAVARSWSGYLDSLFSHAIKNTTINSVGHIHYTFNHIFGDYPDFVAFLAVIVVAIFMGVGAKSSTRFNTIFTIINMCVISFVILYGLTFANLENWTNNGRGNFLPFGFKGVLTGAASCFFAYIGFDSMATSGEEAHDPGKSIPIATFISMGIVSFSYVLMSGVLTLMVPFYAIHETSAFADAFEVNGAEWAKYLVAVGALSGMTTSLCGSLFALPRCVYAMASDGLLFKTLAQIHPKTQVPTVAIMIFGGITSVIALLFDIQTLVEFLSIGTLMAYTIVAASVIILRYKPPNIPEQPSMLPRDDKSVESHVDESGGGDQAQLIDEAGGAVISPGKLKPRFAYLKQWTDDRFPPGYLVVYAVSSMIAFLFVGCAFGAYMELAWYTIILMFIFFAGAGASYFCIIIHTQSKRDLRFKVPLVPFIPSISILANIILMLHLSPLTWIRLAIWLAVGLCVYFLYGIKHSGENPENQLGGSKYSAMEATPAQTPVNEQKPLPGETPAPSVSTTTEKPQPKPKK